MSQLLLPFRIPRRFSLSNLVRHEGIQQAVEVVESVYSKPGAVYPPLFIFGPAGSGKSHLLRAAADLAASTLGGEAPALISATGEPDDQSQLEALLGTVTQAMHPPGCLAVDDVHMFGSDQNGLLWALCNALARWNVPVMMASSVSVREAFAGNEHLESRAISGLVLRLDYPEDSARLLILDKMAEDRQVRLGHEVAHYLVTRKSRDTRELAHAIDTLDSVSLELKRRITLPLVKMLEKQGAL